LLAIRVSSRLNPVIHGDEGVIRIADDGDQMGWDLIDEVTERGFVAAVLVKDRAVGEATLLDESLEMLNVGAGRVLSADLFQAIDVA
jgi:hypothetical protein